MGDHTRKCSSSNGEEDDETDITIEEVAVPIAVGFKCQVCDKTFENTSKITRHRRTHTDSFTCTFCQRKFSTRWNLSRHCRHAHKSSVTKASSMETKCEVCCQRFSTRSNLNRHRYRVHRLSRSATYNCRHCDRIFSDYTALFEHVTEEHPLNQLGGRMMTAPPSPVIGPAHDVLESVERLEKSAVEETEKQEDQLGQEEEDDIHALNRNVQNRTIRPRTSDRYDLLTFLANVRDQIWSHIKSRVNALGGIKWNICVQVEMERDDDNNAQTSTPYFRSRTYAIVSLGELNEHDLNEAMQKIFAAMEKYLREGSGWFVKQIIKLEIHTVVYKPLIGSTYLPLPASLNRTRSILNVENTDNRCFLYCVLASIHPSENHPEKVDQYEKYEVELNMSGIDYPMALPQIDKFERQNENISVNVFTYEDETVLPLRVTKRTQRIHHVNLLWIRCGDITHYCLIKDLNAFLGKTKRRNTRHFYCCYCLHGYTKERLLEEHKLYCSPHGAQMTQLPHPEDNILKFKEYWKTLKVPFVIYADFETINSRMQSCASDPDRCSTTRTTQLNVCGFGYKVVCEDSRYTKSTVVYRGADASRKLLECLLQEQEEIKTILDNVKPMAITAEDQVLIDTSTICCICEKEFSLYDEPYSRVVRHHNHVTGRFIGLAHNECNLMCRQAKHTCVFFHNLKGFDAHILCEAIGEFKHERLKCIAQTTETYVSFSLGDLRFLDSLSFLPSSLETLVNDLAKEGLGAFHHLRSEMSSTELTEMVLRKGVYPYEYMDSFEKFEEKHLPPKDAFYSSLKREGITDEDYAHAQKVFESFGMSTMGDYHDLYLKTDVLLLADVFEAFRKQTMNQFGLDPGHFYTAPGVSWSACLKMTQVELELITDVDQLLMIEAGIRGGVSQISNRYKKANNQYVSDYDPNQESSYLLYIDCNNLYGYAMTLPLPVGDFTFLTSVEKERLDIMAIPEDSETGYVLEVALDYPKELHDAHNDLPLAPVVKRVTDEELSPYAQQLLRKLHGKAEDEPLPQRAAVKKLYTTLEDKDHYILHYRNLQLYLSLGLRVKTIYRVLRFRQRPWMKPYINFNTEMRKRARTDFQKNFYKLMNVSVFGKTMENVRKHKNIELVHTVERLTKISAKPTFKSTTIFNENLVATEVLKSKVMLSKPSYCGMCILDLSKVVMYDFWYNYIKIRWGTNAQLQMTDTDSFLFYCQTDDIYRDLINNDAFDLSDYPKDHPLQNDSNKKVLGKMKDETKGIPISHFIGLRSKMYCFLCEDGSVEKRLKGISRATVKRDIKFKHYQDVLFSETQKHSSMNVLRSYRHQLYGEAINKVGLSAFDDKRYLVNATDSYAYGHYKIQGLCTANVETAITDNDSSSRLVYGDVVISRVDDFPFRDQSHVTTNNDIHDQRHVTVDDMFFSTSPFSIDADRGLTSEESFYYNDALITRIGNTMPQKEG